jgi:hypothetical protein
MAAVWWEERAKEDWLTARATVLQLPTISHIISGGGLGVKKVVEEGPGVKKNKK